MSITDKDEEVCAKKKLPLSLLKNGAMPTSNALLKRFPSVLTDDVLLTDTSYPLKRKQQTEAYPPPTATKKANIAGNMLNGYRTSDNNSPVDDLPVATLSNMGNTCYLNSILYTLRFAPSFLHNLHHLVADLAEMHSKLNQTKAKSSSLGRNISSITGPSCRSSSSKDLLSLGNNQSDLLHPKSKMQIATERLHDLYMSLHSAEMKENHHACQPASFLQALIDVNSIYQGNLQQDAHELLVCLLDILRETCDRLAKQQVENNQGDYYLQVDQQLAAAAATASSRNSSSSKSWSVRRSWKRHKDLSSTSKKANNNNNNPTTTKVLIKEEEEVVVVVVDDEQKNGAAAGAVGDDKKNISLNFVSEDFGGVTLRRTKCLECESVTERKEPFYDICVPITAALELSEQNENLFYRSLCVTTEHLRDTNKYWCEKCIRYNEARREVSYERLPNLLVLQLKRFSTSAGGTVTEKLNNYIPTPLILECFCDQCSHSEQILHTYQLYGVIMHLGSTMAQGHYIAYTRASSQLNNDYLACYRDHHPFTLGSSSSSTTSTSTSTDKPMNLFKFFKPNSNKSSLNNIINNKHGGGVIEPSQVNGLNTCKSKDCCGIRLSSSVIDNALNNREKPTAADAGAHLWLECDDEVVRTLTTNDFQKLLNSKRNSPATPYLLFYSKIQDSTSANLYD